MSARDPTLTPAQSDFLHRYLDAPKTGLAPPDEVARALDYLTFAVRFERGRDTTLPDILEHPRAAAVAPLAADLTGAELQALLPAYKSALAAAKTLEQQCDAFTGNPDSARADIASAIESWVHNPTAPASWFGAFLTSTVPDHIAQPETEEALEAAVAVFLARKPLAVIDATTLADVVAPNTSGKRKFAAPLAMLDADSRIALYGTDALDVNVMEDIAGTGGIHSITAKRRDDRAMEVEITGEVLPGRMEGRLGLESAGFFTYKDLDEDGRLTQYIEGEPNRRWERLHLWGPGFGDEAGAGIYLGPRDINQIHQNKGIENLIRHLGELVLPLRPHGYAVMCTAAVKTWPEPSPGGFFVERVFREVDYQVSLVTPDGTFTANAGLEMLTDPQAYNNGARLSVKFWGGGQDWTELFDRLPEDWPSA